MPFRGAPHPLLEAFVSVSPGLPHSPPPPDAGASDVADGPVPTSLPVPDPGAPAVIVPVDGQEPMAGEVILWSAGAGGMVVTARVDVGAGAAGAVSGRRVWVRARTPRAMVVIQAVAQSVAGRRGLVELTGVSGLAVESRRTALRARLRRSILLLREGTPSRGTWTVDLSSSGCRVRLAADQDLHEGDRLQAVVTRPDGTAMWLRTEVVRVDAEAGEAALHFTDIDDADRNALEREVLTWHSERATSSSPR